jgi:hypothetical protein
MFSLQLWRMATTYLECLAANRRKVGLRQNCSTFSRQRLWSVCRQRARRGSSDDSTYRDHTRADHTLNKKTKWAWKAAMTWPFTRKQI